MGGVIRPRRCTGVWVYKAAPLCWAGRTPPAESGRWIWWRPHQGWRRLGHPLHTAGIRRYRREEKRRRWTILPMWLILQMTDILILLPFYDFSWPLVCCLSVMLIILIIIKHQWVHTGSIWKCLIFWWWHKVSTNALGLLWLTLTRNNLCSKREQRDVKKNSKQNKTKQRNKNSSWLLFTFSGQKNLPVYLPLLVDDAMGFFSGYSAMEPQLSYMDDCREIRHA